MIYWKIIVYRESKTMGNVQTGNRSKNVMQNKNGGKCFSPKDNYQSQKCGKKCGNGWVGGWVSV